MPQWFIDLTLILDSTVRLAVPVLLDIGREPVAGAGREAIFEDAAEALIEEASFVDADDIEHATADQGEPG